jgi:hypothetical protein
MLELVERAQQTTLQQWLHPSECAVTAHDTRNRAEQVLHMTTSIPSNRVASSEAVLFTVMIAILFNLIIDVIQAATTW